MPRIHDVQAPRAGALRNADAVAPAPTGAVTGKALLDGWKAAAYDEGISAIARTHLQPQYQAAVDAASKKLHRALERPELGEVLARVDKKLLEPERARVTASLQNDAAARAKIVPDAVSDLQAHAGELRNPFAPLVAGDPVARARETVLFENSELMVLADKFCPSPKVLVVPKAPALTPLDVSSSTLDALARAARAASDAFSAAAGAPPSDVWINAPQVVTLAQVHVHVQPHLGRFVDSLTPAERGNETVAERRVAQLQDAFWKKFEPELKARLGP